MRYFYSFYIHFAFFFFFRSGMPYVRPMPKLSAVAGKLFFLKCPVAGYPIDSIVIEKGIFYLIQIQLKGVLYMGVCIRVRSRAPCIFHKSISYQSIDNSQTALDYQQIYDNVFKMVHYSLRMFSELPIRALIHASLAINTIIHHNVRLKLKSLVSPPQTIARYSYFCYFYILFSDNNISLCNNFHQHNNNNNYQRFREMEK